VFKCIKIIEKIQEKYFKWGEVVWVIGIYIIHD
jgi:hypothetical protein